MHEPEHPTQPPMQPTTPPSYDGVQPVLPPPPPPPTVPPRMVVTTVPTRQAVLRACLEPLVGYGLTVAASLALMVLVVIAIATGGDVGSDDPSSDLDIEAIGTLVGMPFQLAGMALGGSLRLGDDEFGVSLFAPPLLLTAFFVIAVYRLSKRAEKAMPAASTVERVVLAASGAVATAVVALVVTRLLAMRNDGVVMHSASAGLFFGTFSLAFVAMLLGRLSVHGSLWPRWLPADGRRAAQLVAQHVLAYVVVLLPIAALWLLVEDGIEATLYAVVWGPTIGLFGFGLGHVGALTAFGEQGFAWDLGWFPGVVLPVLAVVLTIFAAIAWHLRRGEDRALLAQPASWAGLPVAYAVGALVVCLVSTAGIGGAFYGVGGGFTVHVAYWLIPVLAVWGAAIEALSRFVAPGLARAVPLAVARRLARGPATLTAPPAVPVQRIPMSPADKARARVGLITAGVVGGVALGGFIVFSVVGSTLYTPEKAAEEYLDALVDGDVEAALELAPVVDDEFSGEAREDLLTNEVYGATSDRITGYEITDVEEFGGTVSVTVDLEGVEEGDDVQLSLHSDGSRAVFFDDWSVDDGGLLSRVTVSVPEGSTAVEANGVSVPVSGGEDLDLWALPGTYSFDPYADNEWLESDAATTTVPGSSYGVYAEVGDPRPSQALMDAVDAEIADHVEECMASTEPDPAGCPQEVYVYGDEVRNLTWTLDTLPSVSWDYFYGTFPVDLYSDVEGSATASYEYDASYGYGKPEWTAETEESSLYLSLSVDIVDGDVQVTFDE